MNDNGEDAGTRGTDSVVVLHTGHGVVSNRMDSVGKLMRQATVPRGSQQTSPWGDGQRGCGASPHGVVSSTSDNTGAFSSTSDSAEGMTI